MNKHIILLRGVNVSGANKIKMAELRDALKEAGYDHPVTYIQSGNIVLNSNKSQKEIAKHVSQIIQNHFDYDVPCVSLLRSDLEATLAQNPYDDKERDKQYFAFIIPPSEPKIDVLNREDYPNEEFLITPGVIYMHPKNGAGKAKLSNSVLERKLNITATTRNLNTVEKLIELAQ